MISEARKIAYSIGNEESCTMTNDRSIMPHYLGKVHPNCDYFHGQIPYGKGIHLYQVSRAYRERPELDDGTGHTYKHAPDLCWYHGRFYIQYLTNPVHEHAGAGVSVLASSEDGRRWGDFRITFPEYWIPACEVTDDLGEHHVFDGSVPAFMHQRMGFYYAKNDVMLVSGFYGWSPQMWMTNWDRRGIGRVVRRLYPDGTLGEIYFVHVNRQGGWRKEQLLYPWFEESGDEELVAACRELLHNSLAVQQWAEEHGDADPEMRIKHPAGGTYQAFCWYHLSEQEVVGLWKHSFVSRSHDGGKTWEEPVKSPSLVMSGQKIWGARTSDGKYALVYVPTLETQHRFPLCLVTSQDGLAFDRMRLVHGEVPPIRYAGFCKDLGPQYMRGICEGMPVPDGDLYLTYSVNKEDIWFAKVPVPMEDEESVVRELDFSEKELRHWNLYQPSWCKVGVEKGCLAMEDQEPYDYARLVRLFSGGTKVRLELGVRIWKLEAGKSLQIELCSEKHQTAVRILFRSGGALRHRTVCELGLGSWKQGEEVRLLIEADCETFTYTAAIGGKTILAGNDPARFRFMAAVNEIGELSIRTGEPRYLAHLEQNPDNLPAEPLNAGRLEHGASVQITKVEIISLTN